MAHAEPAASFRIGKQDKFYEYYALIDVQINGKPVYRCIRDKDNGDGLLFLYYHTDRVWISVCDQRQNGCSVSHRRFGLRLLHRQSGPVSHRRYGL